MMELPRELVEVIWLRPGTWPDCRATRVRVDLAAGLQLVLSIHHHYVSQIQSAGDRRRVVLRKGNRNRPDFNRLVGFDHEDIAPLRAVLDRGGRNHDGALVRFQKQSDIYELVGPEEVVLVAEHGFQAAG